MTDDDRKVAQPCIWVRFEKKSVCHFRLEPRGFCKDSRKHAQAGIGFKSCYAHHVLNRRFFSVKKTLNMHRAGLLV
jgi:hypothetical protein